MQIDHEAALAGSKQYSRQSLRLYDLHVLWFSNTFVWHCPSSRMLNFYNQHIGGAHLDIGVGTGYFLDKCQFPVPHPTITLVDLNEHSLHTTAHRIRRYQPISVRANILEPLPLITTFDSIGMNYLLHCLPGTMRSKGIVFKHVRPLLNPNGVVFGTTILGNDISCGRLAQATMRLYNAKRIFTNTEDDRKSLEDNLASSFTDYSVEVVGCVAFFIGRV
jgi:SAM-dependent methyltransferase